MTDFTTKIHRHTRQEMEKEKCKALLMVAVFLSMYPQLGISSHNNNCNWNHNSNNARACGDPNRNCAGHVGADGSLTLDFPGINTRHQYTGHYDLCEIDCPGAEGSPASLCDKITWPFKQNEYSSLDNYGIIRILERKRLEIRGQARLRNSFSTIELRQNSKFIVHGTLTASSSSTITTSIGSQIIVHGSFDGYSMSTSFTLGENAQLIVHGTLQTSSGITITIQKNATIKARDWNFHSSSSIVVNNVAGTLGNGQHENHGGSHGGSGGGQPWQTGFLQSSSYGGYGSFYWPTQFGSQGRSNEINGGGAVSIHISNHFTFSGSITADGHEGDLHGTYSYHCCWHYKCSRKPSGGGAGGSVLIKTKSFSGNGVISAQGKRGASRNTNHCEKPQSGSGGRVAIISTGTNNAFTGNPQINVDGGPEENDNLGAAGGTIYISAINQNNYRRELISGTNTRTDSNSNQGGFSAALLAHDLDADFSKLDIRKDGSELRNQREVDNDESIIVVHVNEILSASTKSGLYIDSGISFIWHGASSANGQWTPIRNEGRSDSSIFVVNMLLTSSRDTYFRAATSTLNFDLDVDRYATFMPVLNLLSLGHRRRLKFMVLFSASKI